VLFPVPGIYRGMLEENGMPKLGDSPKLLGVRVPPNPNPDIQPDASGNVHPPTRLGSRGLSCAPRVQDLPGHRRPVAWLGTQTQAVFKVWTIAEDDLGPDLVAFRDSAHHITIGPARTMSLDQFRAALAATQSKWMLVIP
jgi:hypothetical protein